MTYRVNGKLVTKEECTCGYMAQQSAMMAQRKWESDRKKAVLFAERIIENNRKICAEMKRKDENK